MTTLPISLRLTTLGETKPRFQDWIPPMSFTALLVAVTLSGFCGTSLSLCPMQGPGHEVLPPFYAADAGMDIC